MVVLSLAYCVVLFLAFHADYLLAYSVVSFLAYYVEQDLACYPDRRIRPRGQRLSGGWELGVDEPEGDAWGRQHGRWWVRHQVRNPPPTPTWAVPSVRCRAAAG